jgi:flavin reductase (DIM6/NTAB) family NADH-FMN oxidoreductase RutF
MPEKVQAPVDALMKLTLDALKESGLLLATQGRDGRPNAMAIGWAAIGSIWRRPMFIVMVRPSRHTFKLLAENSDFTVNVMPEQMRSAVDLCGTVSGRDHDKFAEGKLTAVPAREVKAPIIAESLISYECRTIMTNEVNPATLDVDVRNSAYAAGDFHQLHFGDIRLVHADPRLLET